MPFQAQTEPNSLVLNHICGTVGSQGSLPLSAGLNSLLDDVTQVVIQRYAVPQERQSDYETQATHKSKEQSPNPI